VDDNEARIRELLLRARDLGVGSEHRVRRCKRLVVAQVEVSRLPEETDSQPQVRLSLLGFIGTRDLAQRSGYLGQPP
jgi:hypothetical protein